MKDRGNLELQLVVGILTGLAPRAGKVWRDQQTFNELGATREDQSFWFQ